MGAEGSDTFGEEYITNNRKVKSQRCIVNTQVRHEVPDTRVAWSERNEMRFSISTNEAAKNGHLKIHATKNPNIPEVRRALLSFATC